MMMTEATPSVQDPEKKSTDYSRGRFRAKEPTEKAEGNDSIRAGCERSSSWCDEKVQFYFFVGLGQIEIRVGV